VRGVKILEEKEIGRGRVFSVVREKVELPGGRVVEYQTVRHPGAVVLLPQLKDGRLVLIKQLRPAIRKYIIEFPAGTLGVGEDPTLCAARELKEETGFTAEKIIPLGVQYPAPGFCSEAQHLFFATDLTAGEAAPEEDELLEPLFLTPAEFEQHIAAGEITDAKSIAIYAIAQMKKVLA
jgi:ADP-ribose pyrophosphatase